jgi:hypothetical protein
MDHENEYDLFVQFAGVGEDQILDSAECWERSMGEDGNLGRCVIKYGESEN